MTTFYSQLLRSYSFSVVLEELSSTMDKSAVATPIQVVKTVASQSKKKPAKKPAASKASHPKTSEMVNAAIKELKERGGSSLQAIKKYISANYNVDAEKMAPFIRNYLKTAVTSGSLVQTKGKGASGSFKLVAGEKASGKKKAVSPKVKEPKAKKAKAAPKKSGDVKKSPKSTKTVKSKPTTPSKIKKAKKVPTKKPKAPKPKTVGTAKPKTVKKAATGGLKKK